MDGSVGPGAKLRFSKHIKATMVSEKTLKSQEDSMFHASHDRHNTTWTLSAAASFKDTAHS